MVYLGERILGMILLRPYVFAFLLAYLFVAVSRMGRAKTALFTALAWTIAFLAEFSSTHDALPFGRFPFGAYQYIDTTSRLELWVAGVPFWDSLSFAFLCYVGFSLAVSVFSPLVIERGDFQVADTREIRGSWRVTVTGAMLMTLLDVVIDPLSLRGERWFLGKIYYYPHGGIYFGVPLSNFLGWLFVGAVTIRAFQMLESRYWPSGSVERGTRYLPFGGLLDFGLYLGIVLFNLALTFWIGEPLLGTIAVILYLPVIVLLLSHPLNRDRHATLADIAAHRQDFPSSPLSIRERQLDAADRPGSARARG